MPGSLPERDRARRRLPAAASARVGDLKPLGRPRFESHTIHGIGDDEAFQRRETPPAKRRHLLRRAQDGANAVVAVAATLADAAKDHVRVLAEDYLAIGPVGKAQQHALVILREDQHVIAGRQAGQRDHRGLRVKPARRRSILGGHHGVKTQAAQRLDVAENHLDATGNFLGRPR